jgi:hypothetical protein
MITNVLNGYPQAIKDIIVGLSDLYDEDSLGIILYGSAASNRLVYTITDHKYEFFSDIEFLLIPNNRKNIGNKNYRKEMIRKSSDYLKALPFISQAPFVDVYPVDESYFSKSQLRISTFELKRTGKILKGKNYLELLPNVSKGNYNPAIQNIEIVKALKILLIESNHYFLHNDEPSEREQSRFCYFLYSSYLNILRTLLPWFGYFKPSIEERVALIPCLKKEIRVSKYFSEEQLNKFIDIANHKQKGIFNDNPKELFVSTFEGYKTLLCCLLESDRESLIKNIEQRKEAIFWGSEVKKNQLVLLTRFFIKSLNCLECLNNGSKITNQSINEVEACFDELISGHNAYRLLNIIDKYTLMEKDRWKIIGSKD